MMKAVGSGEERGDGQNASHLEKAKLSVSDLVSGNFKKAWLTLKDIHDKELHRLQVKLTNMRKARLTEGRRSGLCYSENKPGTETREASDSKSCERCLMNETYRKILQQEFTNMQQKSLMEIAELTVENSKLKEEIRKLSEKVKENLPRIPLSFSDSDEDFIPSIQMKRKQVYIVKEPSQPVQLFPRHVMEPHNEQRQSLCDLGSSPSPDDLVESPQLNYQEIFEVPETSMDSPTVEENLAQEANVLPSCTVYSLTTTLEPSKTDDSSLSGVKKLASTEQLGKNTSVWSLSSISSEEPIIVSETSEENMPCKPSSVLPPLTKKKKSNSAQVFPVDYTSKYIQRRGLVLSGFQSKNGTPMRSGNAPLPSKEKPFLKNTSESQNVSTCEKPKSDSEKVLSGNSVLKRKINK